jgi:hypothetical protein
MDWKKELENKVKELNIKEVNDGQNTDRSLSSNRRNSVRSNSHDIISNKASDSNRSEPDRSSSILRRSVSKEINNANRKGGEKIMIGLEGALQDIDSILKGRYYDREIKKEVEVKTNLEKIGAIAKVFLKFLSTMRTNQLLTEEEKKEKKVERDARKAKETQK